MMLGHIVAGDPESGMAYVTPADLMFQDIESSLKCEVESDGQSRPASQRKDLPDPTPKGLRAMPSMHDDKDAKWPSRALYPRAFNYGSRRREHHPELVYKHLNYPSQAAWYFAGSQSGQGNLYDYEPPTEVTDVNLGRLPVFFIPELGGKDSEEGLSARQIRQCTEKPVYTHLGMHFSPSHVSHGKLYSVTTQPKQWGWLVHCNVSHRYVSQYLNTLL